MYRFDPRRAGTPETPLKMDQATHKIGELEAFLRNETRFRMVEQQNPERFKHLVGLAKTEIDMRHALYERLSRPEAPAATLPSTVHGGKQ
jgi:pyruvate-ferredoxin/flavodoxin oxidoreductase